MTYANAGLCISLCLNLFIDSQTAIRKSECRKFDRRYIWVFHMTSTGEKTTLSTYKCNVIWRLKEWILEPEEAVVAMQQLYKHVPAATKKISKIL
jgi:hypothetical protein